MNGYRQNQRHDMDAINAAQMGQVVERDPEDRLDLPPEVEALLIAERDNVAATLRAEADSIATLSPIGFLKRGIGIHAIKSFDLIGRLAKRRWETISFVDGKPGWRVYGDHSEYYVAKQEVLAMLTGAS